MFVEQSTYFVPDIILGARNIAVNKINKKCGFHRAYSSREEKQSTINKQNIKLVK